MRALYNGEAVNVVASKGRDGERVTHYIEFSDGTLGKADGSEVSFECVSLLEWVRSDAWLTERGTSSTEVTAKIEVKL